MSLEIEFQPLSGNHARASFDCGREALNTWLVQQALQQQDRGTSRTVVAVARDIDAWHAAGFSWVTPMTVLAYYALAAAQVEGLALQDSRGRRLPRSVPAARLGRLAVDRRLQGQGFGDLMLAEATVQVLHVADHLGVAGLIVDAKDDEAAAFYMHYGFTPCIDDPLKLWIALGALMPSPS